MEQTIIRETNVNPELLKLLDRGIDDIRMGRSMPHEEAFDAVRRIRNARREERMAERRANDK